MYDDLIGELYFTASNVQSKNRRELLERAASAIKDLKTTAADVRPVVRGKWKYQGQKVIDDLFPTYTCSVCHGVIPADWRRKCNFCPNCGADMRPEPPKEE